MLKGFSENGNVKDVVITEDGKVKVALEDSIIVGNTSSNAIPVNVQNESIVVGNTSVNAVPVNLQNANPISVNVQNASMVVGNTSANPVPVDIQNQSITVGNTSANAVPVNVQNASIIVGNTYQNAIPVDVQNASTIVGNTAQNPVPVNVTNTEEIETTLNASVQTIGTTVTSIAVNKKVIAIDIANYSATANVTITVGNSQFVVGGNIAVTLPINKTVTNLSLVSNETDTKVQVIVKGVE